MCFFAVPSSFNNTQHIPRQNVHDMFAERDDQSFVAKLTPPKTPEPPKTNMSPENQWLEDVRSY